MNRVPSKHFPNTVTQVIEQKWAFDAYYLQTPQYLKAMEYLENRTYDNELYENMINITMTIYKGEDINDITQGATLFFSPELMPDG